MTVSSELARKSFAGDGVTVAFDLGSGTPMVFYDSTDLKVYDVITATGVATPLTLTTHYTVSGGSGASGTVTMVTAPASGHTLVIERDIPLTQTTDLADNDANHAEVLERALDRIVHQIQRFKDRLAFTLPGGSLLSSFDFPAPEALKMLQWNASGTGLQNTLITSSLTAMAVTAFMQTMLDDANAEAARRTLEVQRNIYSLTTNTSLVAADYGKTVVVTGAGGIVLDLTAGTLIDGWTLGVVNSSTGKVTLDPSGAGTIGNSTANSNVFLLPGEACVVVYDGTTGRYRIHGVNLDARVTLNVTANTTINAVDHGKTAIVTGAGGVTLDLAAGTLLEGWALDVVNASSGIVTLDPAGATTIGNSASNANVFVFPGETCTVIYDSVAGRYRVHGVNVDGRNALTVTGNTTLNVNDYGKHIIATSAATLDLAAGTMLDNWFVKVTNASSGKVILDPAGATTIGNFAGAANVAMFPGETCEVRYNAAAGRYIVIGLSDTVTLADVTVSGAATLPVTTFVGDAAFGAFDLEVNNINPATAATDLLLQVSTDGGSTWLTTNEYAHVRTQNTTAAPATITGIGAASAGSIVIANALSSGVNALSSRVRIHHGTNSFTWHNQWFTGNTTNGSGAGAVNAAFTALRLLMSSGNITGTARLIGYRKRI